MNVQSLRELLTAAIDGELSPAERKATQRILNESESARTLFAQLKADAARLKALPRVAAPADLADNVMNVIQERAMTPTPLPPSRRAEPKFNWSAVPIWVNLATAASVLIVVSAGSYLYFTESDNYFARKNAASTEAMVKVDEEMLPATPGDAAPLPPPKDELVPRPPEVIVEKPNTPIESGPRPRVVDTDILVGPEYDTVPEIEPFNLDKIRVLRLFDVDELAKSKELQKTLAEEMKKDELIRLDLFCQSTPNALELVLASLKSRGVMAIRDSFVQDRLKKKAPTEVMIFTEALTPVEVAHLLTALSAADVKSGAGEFDTLVAAPFLPVDLNRLGRLLGVPNVLPKPAIGKAAVDIRKPLPEGTANHVASTLAKLRSGSRKPEKVAVVVAYSPMNPYPTASREIKQFLDRRGERRPEAKPLMLVLRTVK